jgi:hypothetical protein
MIKTNNTTNLKNISKYLLTTTLTLGLLRLFIKSVKFKIFTNAVISQPFFLMVFFVLFSKT